MSRSSAGRAVAPFVGLTLAWLLAVLVSSLFFGGVDVIAFCGGIPLSPVGSLNPCIPRINAELAAQHVRFAIVAVAPPLGLGLWIVWRRRR